MKAKISFGFFLSFALITLSACESPPDVKEMVGTRQSALMWTRPGSGFALNGIRYLNRETIEAQINGDFSLNLTNSKGQNVHIPLPSDVMKKNGELISQAETHTGYNTRLSRVIQPQRTWTKTRRVNDPIYTTTINIDGYATQTVIGYNSTDYVDTYIDGEIEYRLGFYPVRSYIVKEADAVLYMKKPVSNLRVKTELAK